MPAYLITIHTYRSWTEDNPRGYVQRGQSGIQPPRVGLAAYRAKIATHQSVQLDRPQMQLAVTAADEVCTTLGAQFIAASCTATHLHVLVEDGSHSVVDVDSLSARIKSIVGWRLSRLRGTTGNRWFSRGKHSSRVKDDVHMKYLVEVYLPRHETHEGGVFRMRSD